MEEKKLRVLVALAAALDKQGVVWAVGASLLLYLKGIATGFNDIDIVVATQDAQKAKDALSRLGQLAPQNPNVAYATEHFYEYTVDGVEVDVMAGFTIRTPMGDYLYDFDKEAVWGHHTIAGAQIPLCFVEDWYLLYSLMPNRKTKTDMIEEHFRTAGVENPVRFKRQYSKLSKELVKRLESILKE